MLAAYPFLPPGAHADLPDTVQRIKPSIVGIGTFLKVRNPSLQFSGTGFVVADGQLVVTNAHVVARDLDAANRETWMILVPDANGEPRGRDARIVSVDRDRDLALLRIEGSPLPALKLGDTDVVREGQLVAFTGYPIGVVLGLHPATHRATVAAITPIVRPGLTARQLNPKMIARLKDDPFRVYQLDGTAYPGNSGSPVYDPETGVVLAVLNSTLVQGTRESAISRPSGISYAIPVRHVRDLLASDRTPASR